MTKVNSVILSIIRSKFLGGVVRNFIGRVNALGGKFIINIDLFTLTLGMVFKMTQFSITKKQDLKAV